MELIKTTWKISDIKEFCEFEKTLKGTEKDCIWEQKIVNTNLECFGRTSQKAKDIVKDLKKGNYVEFIQNLKVTNMLESLIVAHLISKIKDFETFKICLSNYVETIDNWASCDTLNFSKQNYEELYSLAKEFLKSEKTFIRRVGVDIYFELIKDEKYLKKAFELLNSLKDETEYYVNMCAAWLLSVCFVKYREETLKFFENNQTNSFIINKGISKCRDSFRVNKEDKEFLLRFKK